MGVSRRIHVQLSQLKEVVVEQRGCATPGGVRLLRGLAREHLPRHLRAPGVRVLLQERCHRHDRPRFPMRCSFSQEAASRLILEPVTMTPRWVHINSSPHL